MTVPEIYDDDAADDDGQPHEPQISKRSRGLALAFAVFGGWAGLDRFYVGKIGTAILKLCTGGGLGVWWLYDAVLVASGEFRDSDDLPLRQWELSPSPFSQRQLMNRAERRTQELEEQFEALRQQFNELAERVDFAERMLAQQRETPRPQLPRGS